MKKDCEWQTLLSLFILLLVALVKPFNMTFNQCMVLGALFLVIIWWGTGIVNKNIASLFLIIMFVLFGGTPIEKVFYFPLSSNIILVIASYLLSQGIVKSKVADHFTEIVINRFCDTSKKLVYMSFIIGVGLIFIIPQPFPRVILLSSIYMSFLKQIEMGAKERKIVLFSVFVAATVTSLMFLNGDVIINNAVQEFGEVNISYQRWILLMTLPSLLTTIIIAIAYVKVFKKDLISTIQWKAKKKSDVLDKTGKIALLITIFVVLLWLTESIHGITSSQTAVIGVILMFLAGNISFQDVNVINLSLLIFLTAEFAIGKVLIGSGIAEKMGTSLSTIMPASESIFLLPFLIIVIMALHMIMGSLITALSVLIPTLITLTTGILSSESIVLITTVSVCFHYLMPFHHVTIMLGYGNDYFDNKHVIKFGLVLTLITLIAVLGIYVPWWKFVGVV
jgi:di/tricarboxylate transporter